MDDVPDNAIKELGEIQENSTSRRRVARIVLSGG